MADELVLDSLRRRMRALHSIYTDALDTMGPDQVNHFEREGVLPIAFSLFHIANMVDASFLVMTGDAADLGRRVGGAGPPGHRRPRQAPDAWTRWSTSGSATTRRSRSTCTPCSTGPRRGWTDSTRPSSARVVVARPFPEQVASTFSARVAGPEGVTLLDAAECWIYQHGLRHLGEIELARGLVGLGGMTS